MFVRLSFDAGQNVTYDKLEKINATLADHVKYEELFYDENRSLTPCYYCHTTDPNDPSIVDGKKKLIIKSEYVRLDNGKEYFADLDLFLSEHPELKISIRGMVKTTESKFSNLIQEFQYIYNKLEDSLKGFDKHIEFNEKCDVHIGNLGLLNINQVGYCEDQCTESLQGFLNQGWRILAVCPQPDSRRPDYILGRYNPSEESLECVKL